MSSQYNTIIGMEIHAQLNTKSKMFCGCSNDGENQPPNTTICEVCTAQPGTLPVANQQAIDWTIMVGLATHCEITRQFKFDRKNYFYPDIPKGYQISQYDLPICQNGYLEISGQKINIERIHLEEDTGKLFHPHNTNHSLIDFNRAGTPLIELVTRPDIRDAATAKKFCQRYQQILRFLEVSQADMEKGHLRCEANVSLQEKDKWVYIDGEIKPKGDYQLNPKIELKNINSFRALEHAIVYEIKRQSHLLEAGEKLQQETRGWDDKSGSTYHQRAKESAHDYRYFPEPDLPIFTVSEEKLIKIKNDLPELPQDKINRFLVEYEFATMDAKILTTNKNLADYAEQVLSELRDWLKTQDAEGNSQEIWDKNKKKLAKLTANWLLNKLGGWLTANKQTITETKITPENFAEFLTLIHNAKLNSANAQKVLDIMAQTGRDPSDIIDEGDFLQSDESFDGIIDNVIVNNPEVVAQYQKGKANAIQFLVGAVMKATRGKANPQKIREILTEKLQ